MIDRLLGLASPWLSELLFGRNQLRSPKMSRATGDGVSTFVEVWGDGNIKIGPGPNPAKHRQAPRRRDCLTAMSPRDANSEVRALDLRLSLLGRLLRRLGDGGIGSAVLCRHDWNRASV